jgi:hypothetical protein
MPLAWANQLYTSAGIESAHQIEKAVSTRTELHEVLTHLRNVIGDADLIIEQWRRKHGYAPWFDRADEYGGFAMQMMMEQRPDRENRVVLASERDALACAKRESAGGCRNRKRTILRDLLEYSRRGWVRKA